MSEDQPTAPSQAGGAAAARARPGRESPNQPPEAISAQDWAQLLDAVAAGQVHLVLSTPSGTRVALVDEQELGDLREAVAAAEPARGVLTARERDVLAAVEEGLTISAIADRLGIAQGTVVQHLAAARRKYAVSSSAQAAARAREAGQLG